jgi:mersacidin/lichenicidin family type 2 lantibiotic
MSQVTRVWKDPKFRATLTPEELATLPTHPAGESWPTMASDELLQLIGGTSAPEAAASGGYVCTLTTECPILSFCCRQEQL